MVLNIHNIGFVSLRMYCVDLVETCPVVLERILKIWKKFTDKQTEGGTDTDGKIWSESSIELSAHVSYKMLLWSSRQKRLKPKIWNIFLFIRIWNKSTIIIVTLLSFMFRANSKIQFSEESMDYQLLYINLQYNVQE